MHRRLYFLLPDIDTTSKVVDELLLARIEERHMHVIARHGTDTGHLPEADIRQSSDLVNSAERGFAAGGATGVPAGLTALAFPPAGIALGGGIIAATGLAGAGFGAWVSSMIGIRQSNSALREYEQAIEDGQVLMLVDVPKDRVDEIEEAVTRHHPDVTMKGTDPHKPSFP